MQSIAVELENIINRHRPALLDLPESELVFKSSPEKWSKKEILGHLVDSSQSNIRRLVVAQYEDAPKISYNQDKWVTISNYQQYEWKDLVQLWYSLNKHMAFILKNISPATAARECQTEALHTLQWLASDYVKHLKHHVHQVLELEPVSYP
jgi:hypothetical protein